MVLFIILGVIVLLTVVVLAVLFIMLNKEGAKKEEKTIPITDMEQLKKDLSSQLFEQNNLKVIENESEIIPVFTPKTQMPTPGAQSPLEDDKYKKRAQQLEDELLAISKKATGQSDEAKHLIEALTKENESLKNQQASLEQAKQKLIEVQGEASDLKAENGQLQIQLDSTNAKMHLLEVEMAAVKIQMGEEISRANETISELNREKEALLSAPKPEPDEAVHHELEFLKIEQIQLKQKYEDLEKSYQNLQYELVKARAQSSGLERISFNYKNQLEDFFKKINAMQVSNNHLSQAKNRLEGMVQEARSQNEELVKKDQLSQFEIEKNRSRLVNLERQCEELRARLST